ncbi:MAG: DUF2806 domain-containing protein [Candidatus Pacebacteria bacterium]|nr:DUF2806 domain-containing protein [Candidatus Paceibacterota bacterium]
MGIKDIAGIEKPLEKLIETMSEGFGVVGNHIFEFDVAKINRIGEAEAEVEKKKIIANAEAQEKSVEILSRAEKRFALEQYNKQINLENIIVKTKEDIEGKVVSEDPVEKDWTMRFLDIAQNVSRKEMQNILAKILSGEVQNPGSFSYQTLEIVRCLSQKDLHKFSKFVAISTDIGVIKLTTKAGELMKRYDLSFKDYLDLSSIGLFNQSSMIRYDKELSPSEKSFVPIGSDLFLITNDDIKNTKKFNFGLYVFSNVGKELRLLLIDEATNKKSEVYKKDFIEEAQKKGFKIVRQEE